MSRQVFNRVCLGGTFDTIHAGHEKLLKDALLRCKEILTIAVTDESIVQRKVLWELIKPISQRMDDVKRYLETQMKEHGSNNPFLNIVSLSDPFGPAIFDSTLEAIVVSDETIAGGHKINDIRREKGMKELEVISISLIPDNDKETSFEEDKVSSSSLRIRKLGTLLKEPLLREVIDARIEEWGLKNGNSSLKPYLIGLTGGIASGKSSIAQVMQSLGAGIIECDVFAHQAYRPGSSAHAAIIKEFGNEVVDQETQEILRRKVGQMIFHDSSLKAKLESIVWPAANQLVRQEVERLSRQENKQVIVLEASQLIEAKWHEKLHQLWVSIVPPDVAVKRVMERNGLSEEEARSRVSSQMSNKERVSHANVVFCSLWDRDFTRVQVQRAWNMLNKRFLHK